MSDTKKTLQDMYSESFGDFKTHFEPGEKVRGRITGITDRSVYVDISAKADGIIDKVEFENRRGDFNVGDDIEAHFAKTGKGGELYLTFALKTTDAADDAINDAWAAQIPIEGKVEKERKGGFQVKIGSSEAFCPYSQIDLFSSQDQSMYVGQRLTFIVTEYNASNFVVSRRKHLEAELEKGRKHLRETLQDGDVIEGIVKRTMEFGVFVDIGGIEGLIPMGELSWSRVKDAAEIVKVGETITVIVQKIDWERNRISLSLRKVGGDPWGRVEENYHETKQYRGQVMKLMEFGAFVALEPGIEGLVHISKLGAGKRLSHASEVLKEDQEIDVYIESIDLERRRIALTLENPQQGRTMDLDGDKLTIGEIVEGKVEDIKPFGIFIRLTPTQSGLLHISEIPITGQVNKLREMHKRYPVESTASVIVKAIRDGKVSLTLPESQGEDEKEYREYLANSKSKNFGNLESAFDNLKLP